MIERHHDDRDPELHEQTVEPRLGKLVASANTLLSSTFEIHLRMEDDIDMFFLRSTSEISKIEGAERDVGVDPEARHRLLFVRGAPEAEHFIELGRFPCLPSPLRG